MAKTKADECPCQYCKDDRHPGCHDTCKRYSKWHKRHLDRKIKINISQVRSNGFIRSEATKKTAKEHSKDTKDKSKRRGCYYV